jgi:C4-dicarboxylate-specific signal transduction histidine kinase
VDPLPPTDFRGRVLVVDDEGSVVELLTLWLSQSGYEVCAATDAATARRALASGGFDLVTLDIAMPGGSGLDLLRWVRSEHPDVGVVMASATGDVEMVIEAMRLGAFSYMIKPFQLDLVVHEVNRALERQRLVQDSRQRQEDLETRVTQQTQELRQAYAKLEQQVAEIERRRARAFQADRLQALGEMAAGIAHELSQPLNGIRAFAEGAIHGFDRGWQTTPTETAEALQDIIGQVDRIAGIVDHMRVFARGADEAQPQPFALADVVENALKLLGAQLRAHAIRVSTDIDAALPDLFGHGAQIEQVLVNLLTNARDALDNRRAAAAEASAWKPALSLRVWADEPGRTAFLAVADNGGGMTPEIEARVFDPFFTTKAEGKGTGLGLSISHTIVERHRGHIEVDNRPGDGVTFTIALPLPGEAS